MRQYKGISPGSLPPTNAPDFTSRLRSMLANIDNYLHDTTAGFARIETGLVPSGSGSDIPGTATVDLTDYLYLPGRSGGQTVHGATASDTPLIVMGAALPTQAADFFSVKTPTTILFEIDQNGYCYTTNTLYAGRAGGASDYLTISNRQIKQTIAASSDPLQILSQAYLQLTSNSGAASGELFISNGHNGPTAAIAYGAYVRTPQAGATACSLLVSNVGAGTGPLQAWASPENTVVASITQTGAFSGSGIRSGTPIVDATDPTKKLAFDLSGMATGTTKTITLDSALGLTFGPGLPGFNATFDLGYLTANRIFSLSDSDGFIVVDGSATFYSLNLSRTASILQCLSSTSGVAFANTTGTQRLRFVVSGAVGNNSFTVANTAARDYRFGNIGGNVAMVGSNTGAAAAGQITKIDLTAQTTAIASTNMTSGAPAGYYVVDYTLEVTTAAVGGVSVQFQSNYTDDIGATNQTGAALVLTAQGRDRGSFQCYLASGELSYQTNVVTISTAVWALHVRVTYLG